MVNLERLRSSAVAFAILLTSVGHAEELCRCEVPKNTDNNCIGISVVVQCLQDATVSEQNCTYDASAVSNWLVQISDGSLTSCTGKVICPNVKLANGDTVAVTSAQAVEEIARPISNKYKTCYLDEWKKDNGLKDQERRNTCKCSNLGGIKPGECEAVAAAGTNHWYRDGEQQPYSQTPTNHAFNLCKNEAGSFYVIDSSCQEKTITTNVTVRGSSIGYFCTYNGSKPEYQGKKVYRAYSNSFDCLSYLADLFGE